MSTYLYELPTTGAISFADFCADHSAAKNYSSHITDATLQRASLRAALKESKRTEGDERDYLRQVIDDYLPQLLGIMSCVAHDEIGLREEPVFSWRTTLSANIIQHSPRLNIPTLHGDLALALLTYAFLLSNHARAVVAPLGAYEHDRSISDAERRAKDEKLSFAVSLLCRASGLFAHISERVLVDWEASRDGGAAGFTRPPDLHKDVVTALAKMALADAQTLAIRKLLTRAANDSAVNPGPPLPRSHPSPSLLGKLHLECAELYGAARALAMTPGSASKDAGVTHALRAYLTTEAAIHAALAHKWLGIDAGENGGSEKGGEAVGWLLWAKKELEAIRDASKGVKGIALKKDEARGLRKDRVADELATVNTFLKHYKKTNDSIHFQPVPTQPELQSRIPAGRAAVAAKPYVPPMPAFGPGSVEYTRRQTENVGLHDDDEHAERPGADRSTSETSNYSGAGSYY
ncbi:BRO1-like domain-containing protein [Schizophyllum commune]